MGYVYIVIEQAPEDDRTEPENIAYRVEILDGDALFEEGRPLVTEKSTDSSSDQRVLWAHVGQNDLYSRLRVIPVDAGGNEGPPSNEIELEWTEDGCAIVRRQRFGGWALALVVGMVGIAPLRRRRQRRVPPPSPR